VKKGIEENEEEEGVENEREGGDSDEEWYREEVGQAPKPGELTKSATTKRVKFNPLYKKKPKDKEDKEPNQEERQGFKRKYAEKSNINGQKRRKK